MDDTLCMRCGEAGTYPIGGTLQGPGREIYQAVLASQQAALAACRPGNTLEGIHEVALRTLVEGMVALKMIPGPVDDAIEKESYRPYYMHRTSHWLGLDVHDAGSYSQGGEPRILEPGMVLTVEPGLYIAHNAEDSAVSDFRGIGVRLEDDVAITLDGHENLNSAIPKTPDEVEAWVQGG